MKPEELRIGNVIETQDLGPWHETIVTPQTMELMYLAPETYRGIPLTEEWLVRMGFKERHIYEEVSEWNLGPYRIQTNVEFYIWMGIGDGVELKYVHQLQNLYFALTGQELKLA